MSHGSARPRFDGNRLGYGKSWTECLAPTLPTRELIVFPTLSADCVAINVRGTGAGIPPEHLPNLLERFGRADRSRARATGGAGLGLAIVKQLATAHGGRVAVEGAAGQGSAFTFTLSIALADPTPSDHDGPAALCP